MRSSGRAAPPPSTRRWWPGAGQGGALALDMLAQTPADTLGGAIAVDPAAAVPLKTALCTKAARSRGPDGSAYALPRGRAAGAADAWC